MLSKAYGAGIVGSVPATVYQHLLPIGQSLAIDLEELLPFSCIEVPFGSFEEEGVINAVSVGVGFLVSPGTCFRASSRICSHSSVVNSTWSHC